MREVFIGAISDALAASGESAITAARRAGLRRDAIRSVFRGRSPSLDRADAICRALGITLTIGGPPRPSMSGHAPEPAPRHGPSMETVSEPALATMLAALADEYDALNSAGRRSLEVRFWAMHPDLRERERTLARVVAWLGWRVVEGGAGSGADDASMG